MSRRSSVVKEHRDKLWPAVTVQEAGVIFCHCRTEHGASYANFFLDVITKEEDEGIVTSTMDEKAYEGRQACRIRLTRRRQGCTHAE